MYIQFDEEGEWKGSLIRELSAAGLTVEQSTSSKVGNGLVAGGTGLSDSSGQIRPLKGL
jgi:hypothetical protein